jgi:DNA-binding winged helix-turn-helix (wHTH) protein
MGHPEHGPPPRTVFRAGAMQFDEARMELLVDGQRRPIEAKPLALLHALLIGAGAVVTKRALIEAAWGNADHVSEASLTTGMSKLRTALGDKGRGLIEMVPALGYRITVPVEVTAARDALAFGFHAGDVVPGRPQWRLEQAMGAGVLNDVWLARHDKTGEIRLFKFADSEARLDALRREATLSRVLHATLGARDDLVRILEWNFDTRPYFIESPFGGLDLPAWAATQGGLAAVPLAQRLAMLASVARTIAAAHAAGVLHSDIKPANILVQHRPDGPPQLRLVDFGAGGLSDTAHLAALAITAHGFSDEYGEHGTGTLRYMAPEVLAGGAPTTAADIYALGVLLYQFVTGELTKPLSVGWEEDVADGVLRADIAAAASGDPARRLASAASLADRLETLPARRAEQQAREAEATASALLARQVERARARRPWAIAAALSMVAGLALSTLFGIRARHDRDEARERAAVTQAVNNFLTEDLLGRGNPARSGKADETLMGAAEAAEAGIDWRLGGEPMEAGAIYLSLARAFDSRTDYDAARRAYDHAIADFTKAGDQGRADAVMSRLHEALLDIVSGQPGSMQRAQAEIAEAQPRIAMLGTRRDEATVWLDASRAMLQMFGGDVRVAQAGFKRAADRAEAMPGVFDENSKLNLRQNEAFTYFRLGDWATAGAMTSALLQRRLALNGPLHTATLQLQLNLDQVRIATGGSAVALADLNRIYPQFIAVYGPDHVRTLTLLATRAEAQRRLEHYEDAIADDSTIYRLAAAKLGDRSFVAVGELGDLANTRCRGGHEAEGVQTAHRAYEGAMTNFGAANALTQMVASDLALCLIVNSQPAAAIPLLSHIDTQAVSELTVNPAYGSEVDLLRAAAAWGSGDKATALSLLTKVRPVFQRADADPYMRHLAARLLGNVASMSADGD